MQVRSIVFLSVFFLFLTFMLKEEVRAQEPDCSRLVWFDEFDASGAPATQKWDYDLGGGGWGNNELQTYTNTRANSWIENGKLFIKAVKTNGNWTSARLVTRQKGDWLYGRIEVRAKLPSGRGTWPAIWMLPTDWAYGNWPSSGEIDIMEHVGYDPGVIHGTAHTEAYYHSIGTQKGASITVADALMNFHVYAIEWDEERIRWFVDDQLYFTFINEHKTYKEWPFDKRFHLLLNIAIGGDWGGAQGIDPNLTEATMEIDYVRVYSSSLPKPVITGSSLNEAGQQAEYSVDPVADAEYIWHLPEGVSLISGAGTNKITVQWNDAPGDLQLELRTPCETVFSNVFHVDYHLKPATSPFEIVPSDTQGALLWQALPGEGNSLVLTDESGILQVDFNVTSPAQNPNLIYDFNGLADLSDHGGFVFELKIDPASPPSNLRIDLVDSNGNVNTTNLFKIDSFHGDAEFHRYAHQFTASSSPSFLLDRVRQIRIYLNYGVFGQSGSGTFQLKDMRLQESIPTAAPALPEKASFVVFPNPANRQVTIRSGEAFRLVQLFSATGQLVFSSLTNAVTEFQLPVEGFLPGLYYLKVDRQAAETLVIL
ncbi:MAG: family 16 glycosylhydrolase [Mangrovibacterium sp.]